jgi:hypothetical protein
VAATTTIDAFGDNSGSGGWTSAASPAMLDNPEQWTTKRLIPSRTKECKPSLD